MTSTATAIGEIIRSAAEIERLLEVHRQASGKGLHEKASTASPPLADDTLKKIRFIASVRNKSAHDPLYVPDDLPGYLRAVQEVRLDLAPDLPSEVPPSPKPRSRTKPAPQPPHSSGLPSPVLPSPSGPRTGPAVARGAAVERRARPAPGRPARATGSVSMSIGTVSADMVPFPVYLAPSARQRAPRARHASLVLLVFPLTVLAGAVLGVHVAALTQSPLTGSAAGLAALAVFFVLYAATPLLALLAGGAAGVWALLRVWELLGGLWP